MRQLPNRDQYLEVARQLGAVSYSPGPFRSVRGVSFTFAQLEAFVAKMINPNTLIVDVSETAGNKDVGAFFGLCGEIPLPSHLTEKQTFSSDAPDPLETPEPRK